MPEALPDYVEGGVWPRLCFRLVKHIILSGCDGNRIRL